MKVATTVANIAQLLTVSSNVGQSSLVPLPSMGTRSRSSLTDDGSAQRLNTLSELTVPAQTKRVAPSIANFRPVLPDSTPLQIWEGTVICIDDSGQTMHVSLEAKIGAVPRHAGDIDLEWVSEQDKELVRPGAVFYLTLFKRSSRGSIENSQELRFRRRPSWSRAQISRLQHLANAPELQATEKPQAE